MTTPSWAQWRATQSSGNGLNPQTIRDRMLACLACLISNTNPDGTVRGS